jgi:hypothetical protein
MTLTLFPNPEKISTKEGGLGVGVGGGGALGVEIGEYDSLGAHVFGG